MKLYIENIKGEKIEVTESTFQIDGYSFADRLLEGFMFNIHFKDDKVLNVEVDKNYAKYFDDFNTVKWLSEARKYAQRILDSGGDEVYISKELILKYNAKVAWIE